MNTEWKLVRVNEAFSDLMFWLERCEQKGHLENCYDLVDPWAAFEYEYVDAAPPAPTSHPIPTGATGEDERKAFETEMADPLRKLLGPGAGGMNYWNGDEYDSAYVQAAWFAWKARAAIGAPAAGDALDLVSLLNIRFTPVSEGLPDLVEYSPSYAGQWSSKWCAVITARGNIESSQFVLPSSEKEALEAARFNGVWRSGMSPSRVVAWAYMDHIRSAAEAAAIAQQSQRKEA